MTGPPTRAGATPPSSWLGGLVWTAANSWSVQLINLGVFVLLARLLEPAAFGLVAMAGVFVHVCGILVDQGMSTALVQRAEIEPEHTDTAFWLGILFGVVLTLAGILLSGPIAGLFRTPELGPIVALLSWNFLINAFSGVQQALLTRTFQFRLLAVRSLGAAVAGGCASVVLAVLGFGPMALVAQLLCTSLAGVILLWSVSGWRPGFRVSARHARDLLGFGVKVLGIRLLNAMSRRSDDLLIGYFLGPVALGYYTVAYKVFKVMIEVFTKIVTRVALPTFSALQADRARVSASFCDAIRLTSLLAFPMFVGLGVLASDVVPLMFGAQWSASVPVMQILVLMGMLQTLQLLGNQVLMAMGRPEWSLRFLSVSTALSIVGFAVSVRWGITAVAVAYTVVGYALFPWFLVLLRRLLGLGFGTFFRQVRPALAGCAAMVAVLLALREFAAPTLAGWGVPAAGVAAILALAGAAAYLAVVLRLEPALLRPASWRRGRDPAPAPAPSPGVGDEVQEPALH